MTLAFDALRSEVGLSTFAELLNRPGWHEHAACRGVGPAVFFPASGQSLDAGRELCGSCCVRAECLDDAVADRDRDGLFGGASARQRARMRLGEHVALDLPQPRARDAATVAALAWEAGVSALPPSPPTAAVAPPETFAEHDAA